MNFQSNFLKTIAERGFIHQGTNNQELDALLCAAEKKGEPVVAYCGFDCTGMSLHVGSLMQIMILRWFQKCGHKPIVLLGGGTTKIGDPSGKDEARKMLADADIARNMKSLGRVFEKFLTFENVPNPAMTLDNDAWLSNLSMAFMMGTLGPLISINSMLAKDSIRNRLERHQHLSYLEFNYMILQAYDFVKLYEDHACRLQFGGSDQWGNITAGVELHHKMQEKNNAKKEHIFGLTTPLITTTSGAKMGKTEAGAVWLNEDMLSHYDYWQFWRNTEDADVGRFLRLFTDLPLSEISRLEALQGADINEAKKILANEATTLCHGEKNALQAAETARKTFEEGQAGDSLPEFSAPRAELEKGIPAYQLFHLAGLEASGGKARKLIQGNGAKINDEAVMDENRLITLADFSGRDFLKLSAGKKRHVRVTVA